VFSSSDTNIATVDENTGEVTGVAPGTVTITASTGDITATYSLEVSLPTALEKTNASSIADVRSVNIYNITGQLLLQLQGDELPAIHRLPAGIYIIETLLNNGTKTVGKIANH
jgi:hypothetical protein